MGLRDDLDNTGMETVGRGNYSRYWAHHPRKLSYVEQGQRLA